MFLEIFKETNFTEGTLAKFVSLNTSNDIQQIQFEYGKDQDPREDLFRYAVENNWTILKMTPHTTNLEDIFRDLTTESDAHA